MACSHIPYFQSLEQKFTFFKLILLRKRKKDENEKKLTDFHHKR